MFIINTIQELKCALNILKADNKTIGLVPTMGALHNGHISLVERCRLENDVTVVSVFVNPSQFNDPNDLLKYPRTPEKDFNMLDKAGCEFVFYPSVSEMYPEPDTRVFNLGYVAEIMEGAHRPGHFNGVAQIVSKLFDIVEPDNAYFGEKDFQQIAVIRSMTEQLGLMINIIPCPIIREDDGLAMSSRNALLTAEQRKIAPIIASTLKESSIFATSKKVDEVKTFVITTLNNKPYLRVEYFEIVDYNTLQPINNWNDASSTIGCIAVFCGETRLIDNIKY